MWQIIALAVLFGLLLDRDGEKSRILYSRMRNSAGGKEGLEIYDAAGESKNAFTFRLQSPLAPELHASEP